MVSIKTPENYLQQAGLISKTGEYVAPLATRVLIITGPTAWRAAGEAVRQSLTAQGIIFEVTLLQGKCTLATLRRES